jgi:hypothetical protein
MLPTETKSGRILSTSSCEGDDSLSQTPITVIDFIEHLSILGGRLCPQTQN